MRNFAGVENQACERRDGASKAKSAVAIGAKLMMSAVVAATAVLLRVLSVCPGTI